MTDEQVIEFVNGCMCSEHRFALTRQLTDVDYPAYELYTERLRNGIFDNTTRKQLRLVVGKDRKVKEVIHI